MNIYIFVVDVHANEWVFESSNTQTFIQLKLELNKSQFFFVKYVQMAQNYVIMLEILMQYLYKRGMKL